MTDSEGTTASAEEVNASMKQAFVRTFARSISVGANIDFGHFSVCGQESNIPVDAQQAEQNEDKYASGAPGHTEEAETDHEQKEKPGSAHTGTIQNEDDKSGPTDLGDAREASTVRLYCAYFNVGLTSDGWAVAAGSQGGLPGLT